MGRWRPLESDEYIRNQIGICDKIQKAVALSLKTKDTICSSDAFTLEEIERECLKRGIEARAVADMCQAILAASTFHDPLARSGDAEEVALAQGLVDGLVDDGWPRDDRSVSSGSHQSEKEAGPAVLSAGSWVVNDSRKTLHRIGSCWRQPGVHFKRFTILDPCEVADPHATSDLYSRLCCDCFPRPAEADTSSSDGEAELLCHSD